MVNSTSNSSNSTSEPTYPVRGIGNDDPLYWTQIQISINSIYLFCIIGLLIAVWRLKKSNEKSQNRTFYLLIASMLLIGVTTVFTISSKLLFLVDAHLGINYQIFKGIFALFYFPGETVLIATIFSVLYNRFQNINLGSISNSMSAIRALFKFIVFISFILSTILIIANFIYTEDVISAASDSYPLWEYPVGWSKIATSYRCVIVVIGLHFLGFSASLLSSTKEQKSPNSVRLVPRLIDKSGLTEIFTNRTSSSSWV